METPIGTQCGILVFVTPEAPAGFLAEPTSQTLDEFLATHRAHRTGVLTTEAQGVQLDGMACPHCQVLYVDAQELLRRIAAGPIAATVLMKAVAAITPSSMVPPGTDGREH